MNTIRALAVALAATACAGSSASTNARVGTDSPIDSATIDSPTVVSPYLVIVPRSVTPDLLDQCTRHVPQGLEGTWNPTPGHARRIENLFRQRFDTATWCLTNYPPSDPPLRGAIDFEHYALQLGGVILQGRRFIYVNGLPRWLVRTEGRSLKDLPPEAASWHHKAVGGCDGGAEFFGILYDPAADTLGRIDFNADVIGGAWLCDEARQPRRMPPHN